MVTATQQGYDAQAKQSTRLLARGASAATQTTDLSQYLTNLTAGTNCSYELTSTRFNHYAPRTIGVRLSMTSAHVGTLYRHGAGATTERLEFSAANTLRVVINNAAVGTLAVTAPTGTDTVIVAWITEANPDTTGAADAHRSWIMWWNVTDGLFNRVMYTHAVNTSGSSTALYGADDIAGAAAFTGTMTGAWFENRAQSGAEIGNDWVSSRSAPTTVLEPGHQGHPPQAETFDADNYHHGPAALWAADATRRIVRRTLSPLVNEVLTTQPDWTEALLESDNPMIRGAPSDDTFRLHLGWARTVVIPPTCNAVWARLHLRSWTTSGAAVALRVRVYSMSRIPGAALDPQDQGAADPMRFQFVEQTITRDDDREIVAGAGLGNWTTFGLLPIAAGRAGVFDGKSVFAVGVNMATNAVLRVRLRAIQIVPAYSEIDGGLPFGEGP